MQDDRTLRDERVSGRELDLFPPDFPWLDVPKRKGMRMNRGKAVLRAPPSAHSGLVVCRIAT